MRKNSMSRDSADRMIASVPVAKIRVGERSRALCDDALASLVESIKSIGLQTPISVQIDRSSHDERYLLVAGRHRLEACRRLGVAHIDTRIVDLDEVQRKLWEIAENLHRAELTVTERSEHIAEWIRLMDQKVAQLEPPGGKQPKERGIRKAAKELGIDRADAQRAVKIASLTPEAKDEAQALGLDDNQRALLDAARAPTKEAQIQALREEAARKAARHDDAGASERRLEVAVSAVKRLSQDELAAFADWFGAFRAEREERTMRI
jgi:ParB-like chromosome segregation protein Spo0J